MTIRNLKKDGDRWTWDMDGTHYKTNADGEGLFIDKGYEVKQITGTCQYSMRGCNTCGSAYNHIRRYFED